MLNNMIDSHVQEPATWAFVLLIHQLHHIVISFYPILEERFWLFKVQSYFSFLYHKTDV